MTTLPISVVIPAFNRAETLERAIRSVYAQTSFAPAEIIVSDDASTDDTAFIAEQLGARVLRSDVNQGSGPTRNAALAAATQPWVAFLDSDDEWLPDHLQTVWSETANASFISTTAASVLNGKIERLLGCPYEQQLQLSNPIDLLVPENPVITSSVLIRRSLLDKAGGFRALRRAQDLDLWIRVLEQDKGVVLPRVTVRYYHGDDQATKDVALMEQNRLDILSSYATSPWNTKRVATKTMAARRWDAMRGNLRRSERYAALKEALWFVAHVQTLPTLLHMLANRRSTRQRTRVYVRNLQTQGDIPMLARR